MIREFIYSGLLIRTSCKYFQAKEGVTTNFIEKDGAAVLTVCPGSTAAKVSDLTGLKLVGPEDTEIESTPLPKLVRQGSIELNGLKLDKLTLDDHTLNIIIVSDSESRVVQSYKRTVIVVSEKDYKNPEFINFLFFSGHLLYLKPSGKLPKGWEIRNFPKIIIKNSHIELESESDTVYNLRKRYDDYVIREIDYQDQFILEVRRILEDYGVQLVRINKEAPLVTTSYVQYQFIQTPIRATHPFRDDINQNILSFHQPIEFILHTNDMVLYHDFKNKYLNVELLTRLTEFKTTDRYGKRWSAAVKWGDITEEFNQVYQPDDNSNFSYQCQFRCDMYFYEVRDDRFRVLEDIYQEVNNDNI